MNLVPLISLALCAMTSAKLQREETTMNQGDIKLLNQLLETAAAILEHPENDLAPSNTNRVPTKQARPNPYLSETYRASDDPIESTKHQIVYSDGAFSDIPSDAFQLEHRKDFREDSHVSKKDLSRDEPGPDEPGPDEPGPDELIETCLEYFRGGSHSTSTELILNICTELLDTEGIEEFSPKQTVEPLTSHHHSEECECCPYGHHHVKNKVKEDELSRTKRMLDDVLKLFKPVRREWMVLNSDNPDDRLRTYVDLKR